MEITVIICWVSVIIVGGFLAWVVFLRIIPGTVKRVTKNTKVLIVKRDEQGWVVEENGEPAESVKVSAGQTITWKLADEAFSFIQNHLAEREDQAQAQGVELREEDKRYIMEISLPSGLFSGIRLGEAEHAPWVVTRDMRESPKASHTVRLLAIPGIYPYAIEITKDTGIFARGGSHTRVHTGPW